MHSLKSHIFKKKNLLIALIGFVSIALVLATHYFKPPSDIPDTLKLLYLNKNSVSTPLFRMQPQQTYSLAMPELSLTMSELSLNSPELSLDLPELSLSKTSEPMHLMVTPENLDVDLLLEQLTYLSQYTPLITVSLISTELSDEAYINFASSLHVRLQTLSPAQIELIWYPKDVTKLVDYDMSIVENIGVVIESSDDLSRLEQIYSHFSESKNFYIRDCISHFYKNNVSKAAQEINTVYHLLAVQYPRVTTIFSPYRTHSLFPDDTYYLDTHSADYNTLCSIYYHLAHKPWITFSYEDVSNISPYQELTSDSKIFGEVEIILNPCSNILSNIPGKKSTSTNATYLTYKINEQVIPVQAYYPYLIDLDTSLYPAGISRIKASSYTKDNELVETQSIDVEIVNSPNLTRSKRIPNSYSVDLQPIYKKEYIPVLMYHSILEQVSEEEQNSCVEISVFDSQIKALIDNGYTPINFKVLKDYILGIGGLPEKPILITMDDGYLNNYTNAYPIYKKYGVQATLFVSPYYMSEENTERHFGWKAAKEMEESGLIDIQSHGYNHTPFPYLSLKELKYHISHSFGLIQQHLGARDTFVVACPQFRNTSHTRKLLTSLGIDFQMTKLAKTGTVLSTSNMKRINVPNTMTPSELITKLESLTM